MKSLLFVFTLICTSISVFGQQFSVVSESETGIWLRLQTPQIPFKFTNIGEQNHIDFSKNYSVVMQEAGSPALPLFSTNVELPNTGNPIIEVVYGDNFTEFSNVSVAPSKGNLKRNVNPKTVAHSFSSVYQQDDFYPFNPNTPTEPFIFRALRGMTIQLSPYRYNPVTKTLRFYPDIQVIVNYNQTEQGLNEKQFTWNDNVSLSMRKEMFINHAPLRYTVKDEEGEMLIITHSSFEAEMQSFANWKNQKGIRTKVVSTDDAGTNPQEIKNYISSYFSENPNTLYLVLVGDHQQVPAYSYGNSGGEQLWSDTYYGQLLGNDHYPELFVGRFSGTNSADIRTQVERTLEYEKAPKAGDWMEKAAGVGSHEGAGYGNLGLADWDHLRQIRIKLMSFGYTTVHEFYEGSQGGEDAPGDPTVQMLKRHLTRE